MVLCSTDVTVRQYKLPLDFNLTELLIHTLHLQVDIQLAVYALNSLYKFKSKLHKVLR